MVWRTILGIQMEQMNPVLVGYKSQIIIKFMPYLWKVKFIL